MKPADILDDDGRVALSALKTMFLTAIHAFAAEDAGFTLGVLDGVERVMREHIAARGVAPEAAAALLDVVDSARALCAPGDRLN